MKTLKFVVFFSVALILLLLLLSQALNCVVLKLHYCCPCFYMWISNKTRIKANAHHCEIPPSIFSDYGSHKLFSDSLEEQCMFIISDCCQTCSMSKRSSWATTKKFWTIMLFIVVWILNQAATKQIICTETIYVSAARLKNLNRPGVNPNHPSMRI